MQKEKELMALDAKRLQKKKAKRAAKAKERKKAPGHSGAIVPSGLIAGLAAPFHECWWPENLFKNNSGFGQVVVSRRAGGQILVAVFLLDVFCLGAKDAFIRPLSGALYEELLEGIRGDGPLKQVEPACARKLVESAVAYARGLGLPPHKDYAKASRIFGDIDADACPQSFDFGRDGKPFYSAGPYDSPVFIRRVMRTLEQHCGADGFHYLLSPYSMFE
jgi:hypothetical protein